MHDDDTAAALQSWYDRAERLVHFWEREMVDAAPPHDPDFVSRAEVVVWEMDRFLELRDAVTAVPDEHEVEHQGATTTVGELTARVLRIGEAARAVIDQADRSSRSP